MIVGSVYLGKKARKAYRKRQAQKAAEQLTSPIEIVDPSEEIVTKAPPRSPELPGQQRTHLRNATQRDRPMGEQEPDTPKEKEWQSFTQPVPVDLDIDSDLPPAYDVVVSASSDGSCWNTGQNPSPSTQESGHTFAKRSSHDNQVSQQQCSVCQHVHQQSYSPSSIPNHMSTQIDEEDEPSTAVELDASQSAIAELPASELDRIELPGSGSMISEMDTDTSTSHRCKHTESSSGFFELPA